MREDPPEAAGAAGGLPRPDFRLPRSRRVTRSAEFREAFDQGRRYTGRLMVLWLRHGDGASLRLGVVASRKVGNAVCRARAKRRVREVFRMNRHRLRGSADLVVVSRQAILSAPHDAVEREFLVLSAKAGLHSGVQRDHEKK